MRSLGHRLPVCSFLGVPRCPPIPVLWKRAAWRDAEQNAFPSLSVRDQEGRGETGAGVCADCPHRPQAPHGSHAEAQLPPVLPPGMVRAGRLHVRASGCSRHRLPRGPPTALCSPGGWAKPWYQAVPGAACEAGAGAGGRGGRGKLPVLQLPPHLLTLGGELAPSPACTEGEGRCCFLWGGRQAGPSAGASWRRDLTGPPFLPKGPRARRESGGSRVGCGP